jgi:hypothetical protein
VKRIAGLAALLMAGGVLMGCTGPTAADRANENLSKAAENFEVPRRIIGINGITDTVLFSVEGFCSYEIGGGSYQAICKEPDGSITRTTLAKSDNVTIVVTQLHGVNVDLFRSRVIFRPETIIPDFELSTS